MDEESSESNITAAPLATDKFSGKGVDLVQLMQVAAIAQEKQNQLEKDIVLIKRGLVALSDEIGMVITLLKDTR